MVARLRGAGPTLTPLLNVIPGTTDRIMRGPLSQESGRDATLGPMEGYDEATYGDRIADVYDDWYGEITDTEACVDGLRRLAGDGPVLELGVGTGRLAI